MDETTIYDWIFGGGTADPQALSFTSEDIQAFADSYANSDPGQIMANDWIDMETGARVTAQQAMEIDREAFTRDSMAARSGGLPEGHLYVNPEGEVVDANNKPADPAFIERVLKGMGGGGTDLGRALTTLLLGGAGVGLAAGLTPGAQKLTLPAVPLNPVQAAGQKALLGSVLSASDPLAAIRQAVLTGQMDPTTAANALKLLGVADPAALVKSFQAGGGLTGATALSAALNANVSGQATSTEAMRQAAERALTAGQVQAPTQELIRALALGQVPGAVATPEPTDPVNAAIRDRVLLALRGGEVDPGLERTLAEQKDVLLNKLARMYGRPGQETEGTVGGALALNFDQRANELRYQVNRDILNALAPQEQARTAYTAGRGDIKLGQNVAFSGFGLTPPTETAKTLAGTMPIEPMLGINDTSGAQTAASQAAAAVAAYNAQNASSQNQATALSGLFGTAARSLTAPTYNFTMANPAAMPAG